jgi:hypothetical protein
MDFVEREAPSTEDPPLILSITPYETAELFNCSLESVGDPEP